MIFCVEDDAGIRNMMVYALNSSGFEAEGFPDGESFFAALKAGAPDLVLLDVMLPGEDGVSILRRLRAGAAPQTPVIMATAKGEEYDKVTTLDLGADDYLVKPFGMLEMVSRVRAVLRRAAPKADAELSFGPIKLDPASHMVISAGERVELTLKEFELLRLFLENPGRVFTRDQLLNSVWGGGYDGETRTVDVHIRTLRQKLGAGGALIGTVRGVGYRLEAR